MIMYANGVCKYLFIVSDGDSSGELLDLADLSRNKIK